TISKSDWSSDVCSSDLIQALRNMKFFSIEELNRKVSKKLDELNNRPFQNRKGSRWSAFLEEEKFALSPLPATPYRLSEWRTAREIGRASCREGDSKWVV